MANSSQFPFFRNCQALAPRPNGPACLLTIRNTGLPLLLLSTTRISSITRPTHFFCHPLANKFKFSTSQPLRQQNFRHDHNAACATFLTHGHPNAHQFLPHVFAQSYKNVLSHETNSFSFTAKLSRTNISKCLSFPPYLRAIPLASDKTTPPWHVVILTTIFSDHTHGQNILAHFPRHSAGPTAIDQAYTVLQYVHIVFRPDAHTSNSGLHGHQGKVPSQRTQPTANPYRLSSHFLRYSRARPHGRATHHFFFLSILCTGSTQILLTAHPPARGEHTN